MKTKTPRKRKTEKLVILGSTGSIGRSTAAILREEPGLFDVVGLAAGRASEELAAQTREFRPRAVAVRDGKEARRLERALEGMKPSERPDIHCGPEGLERLAAMRGADVVVNALCGAAGIQPTLAAVEVGKTLLIANKEAIVAAGEPIFRAARKSRSRILPLDSEHSAIHQCLRGENPREVKRLILTASGGPFAGRKHTRDITPQMALAHPKWSMGPKVTVDSATLMNKGLEIIEAMWLFRTPPDRIHVLVHPECVVHSMVEFQDGVVMAQMCAADMRIPIRYALRGCKRPVATETPALDWAKISALHFYEPDTRRFPCLDIARAAAVAGGLFPAAMCGADEVAVEAFLAGRIRFDDIPAAIEDALSQFRNDSLSGESVTLETIMAADTKARAAAKRFAARARRVGR